jgi:hypothetical protein
MMRSIPTYRPMITPARIATAAALLAVLGNLYLLAGDAMATRTSASAAPPASACAEAVRGRYPGDAGADALLAKATP